MTDTIINTKHIWKDLIQIEILSDDIFVLKAHNVDLVEEHTFEFDQLKELQAYILKLSNGRPVRLLTDAREVYVKIPTSVLKQVANDESINETKIAEALVLTSLPNRLWVNFYLNIARPKVPAKAFSTLEKACEWLRTKH